MESERRGEQASQIVGVGVCPPPGSRAVITYRAGKLAVSAMPPRGASTGSSLGAADSVVGTLATGIATEAPGARGTGHRAVTTLPTWRGQAGPRCELGMA